MAHPVVPDMTMIVVEVTAADTAAEVAAEETDTPKSPTMAGKEVAKQALPYPAPEAVGAMSI